MFLTHMMSNNHLTLPFVGIVKSRTNVNFTSYMCEWLIANNVYFSNITINHDNISALPENDYLTNVPTVSVPSDLHM